jgi:hypothetical protein
MLLCTMRATIEDAIRFHAMTNHPAATMRTGGRQGVDGAFETVEDMRFTLHMYLKTFIVYVAAYLTPQTIVSLYCPFSHHIPLSLLFYRAACAFLIF